MYGGGGPEHLSAPEDEVGGGEERHADGDDPSRAMLVGEATGDGRDQGSGGSYYAEGAGDAWAQAVVAVEEEGERGPEAAEGGEDQGSEDAGLAQQGLGVEERPEGRIASPYCSFCLGGSFGITRQSSGTKAAFMTAATTKT